MNENLDKQKDERDPWGNKIVSKKSPENSEITELNEPVESTNSPKQGLQPFIKNLGLFILYYLNFSKKHPFISLALLLTTFGFIVEKAEQSNSQKYSTEQKANICKAYIGALFSKPTSIIVNYQNDDDLAYVSYVRNDDNSHWKYVCIFDKNTITWSGWQNDTSDWGRIRTEDERILNYNKENNTVSFKVYDDSNEIVTVRI